MASAQHLVNQEGYSTITDPFHWRNMSRPPTDLLPHIKEVVTIQDEFRTHFEWGLDHDQLSAKELISIVEDSGIDLWSRPNRRYGSQHTEKGRIEGTKRGNPWCGHRCGRVNPNS